VDIALLALRLLLAAVFLVASVGKLMDGSGSRRAAREFGVPDFLAAPVGTLLPLAELALAILLLPGGTARFAALGALGLLATFSFAIAVNLARGHTPDCHCFGQLHSEPAGWKTLARNVVLGGVAAFVAIAGTRDAGPSAVAWIGTLDRSGLVALITSCVSMAVIGAVALVVTHVLRSHGQLLLRIDRLEAVLREAGLSVPEEAEVLARGLPVGSPAPEFALETLESGIQRLNDLLARGRDTVLVFTDPGCGPCRELMPQVVAWQRDLEDQLTVAVICAGDREEARKESERGGLRLVLFDPDRRTYDAYLGAGTPCAVLVAADGSIASPLAAGAGAVRQLVARVSARHSPAQAGLPVGAAAPDLTLETLTGERMSLGALRGREVNLLFWNPSCGYCRQMHARLVEHERRLGADDARLVIVSAGDRDAIRAEGFASLVLLDGAFTAGAAFKAGGTPTGVAIDAGGRIASHVSVGADAVLSLIARKSAATVARPN
jgi:thiol-disulfide isomerase/thioredoxin/uncharacterized membrane protein YphA (DoxX/SURF4 family)